MKKILVFASGSGSNFRSIINAVQSGELKAEIVGLIINKKDIGAISHAESFGISVKYINEKDFKTYDDYCIELVNICRSFNPDVIALAGYLRKIPVPLIDVFEGKILNIHPSLLPKFGGKGMYGIKVHEAVLAAQETESGCTVHIVTKNFDEGPILGQAKVTVFRDDSPDLLQKRVLKEEHQLYPKVLKEFLTEK